MTKAILEKLDTKHKYYLESCKDNIKSASNEVLKRDRKMRVKGYLLALQNCNIITQYETRVLYTYITL